MSNVSNPGALTLFLESGLTRPPQHHMFRQGRLVAVGTLLPRFARRGLLFWVLLKLAMVLQCGRPFATPTRPLVNPRQDSATRPKDLPRESSDPRPRFPLSPRDPGILLPEPFLSASRRSDTLFKARPLPSSTKKLLPRARERPPCAPSNFKRL